MPSFESAVTIARRDRSVLFLPVSAWITASREISATWASALWEKPRSSRAALTWAGNRSIADHLHRAGSWSSLCQQFELRSALSYLK